MAGGLTDDCAGLKASRDESVVPGALATALGVMVMAIAAVEYFVFIRISAPATVADSVFGLSFGTTAYLASYVGAGAILITLGIWKIYRACGRNP